MPQAYMLLALTCGLAWGGRHPCAILVFAGACGANAKAQRQGCAVGARPPHLGWPRSLVRMLSWEEGACWALGKADSLRAAATGQWGSTGANFKGHDLAGFERACRESL